MNTGNQSGNTFHHMWLNYVSSIEHLLSSCIVTDKDGMKIDMDTALRWWRNTALACKSHGEIVFIGNGASASIASHCAADIMKNARIRTRLFTDLSLLTAMGNDEGYENVFMIPIQICMKKSHLLVAISSSGQSANILNGVYAAQKKGVSVMTLSAFNENNPLRKTGDCNIFVNTNSYGLAESCHAAILHCCIDILMHN